MKAIEEELPAPEDITIVCQYCDAKFTDKISLINHMKIAHNADESELEIPGKRVTSSTDKGKSNIKTPVTKADLKETTEQKK